MRTVSPWELNVGDIVHQCVDSEGCDIDFGFVNDGRGALVTRVDNDGFGYWIEYQTADRDRASFPLYDDDKAIVE